MIATGYWDLPGTALVYEELKDFFVRGGKLDLLIGQEPQLQYYQASSAAHKFPDFYIQRDVESLTYEYKSIGKLIIENALTDEIFGIFTQTNYEIFGKSSYLYAGIKA